MMQTLCRLWMRESPKAVLVTGLLLLSASALAATSEFQAPPEGWFWYKDPPKADSKPKPEPPKPPEATPPVAIAPPPVAPQPSQPPAFSSQWLRTNLPRYLDQAMDEPTPDHVKAYLALQRVALDKASAFTTASSFAVTQNKDLDESALHPISGAPKAVAAATQNQAKRDLLKKLAKEAGIWYFFRSDCPYCKAQGPALSVLASAYGFHILPISMDGGPPPNEGFKDYVNDAGQARLLGVDRTPTLYLVHPGTNDKIPISSGFVTEVDIEDRILVSAGGNRWITQQEFASTQSIAPSHSKADRKLKQEILDALPPVDKYPYATTPPEMDANIGASP
ncbi:MAG: conjugal transfer protein TraF [Rhizobium sp.]|nr:MAG: conjugal transfer protein TraF [Rhizobium sp.]